MLTKEAVLREIPLRKYRGDVVHYKEFSDLKRVIESQMLTETDLDFMRRKILARAEKYKNKRGAV